MDPEFSNKYIVPQDEAEQNGSIWLNLMTDAVHKAFLIKSGDMGLNSSEKEKQRIKLEYLTHDFMDLAGASVEVCSIEDGETLASGGFVKINPNSLKMVVKPGYEPRKDLVFAEIVSEPERRYSAVKSLVTLSTRYRYRF